MAKAFNILCVTLLGWGGGWLAENNIRMTLPGNFASYFRIVVIIMGGFAVGMLKSVLFYYEEVYDRFHVLYRPLCHMVIIGFCFWVYSAVDLFSWITVKEITWRAPSLFVLYLGLFLATWNFKRYLRREYNRLRRQHEQEIK